MIRPIQRLWLLAVLIIGLSVGFGTAAGVHAQDLSQDSLTDQSWDLLWSNNFTEAEHGFRQAVEADKKNGAARRGLLLALCSLGKDDETMKVLEEHSKHSIGGVFDFFIPAYFEYNASLESRKYAELQLEYVKRLLDKTKGPLPDRMIVQALVGSVAYGAGDFDLARKTGEKLNRLKGWYILGPFDNTSGSGHRKDHIGDSGYALDHVYEGKFGQPIFWFSPPKPQIDGTISPTNHLYRTIYTTNYLCLDIEVSEETPAAVSLSYFSDTQFYFDGNLIFDGKAETGGDEIKHWETVLSPGCSSEERSAHSR